VASRAPLRCHAHASDIVVAHRRFTYVADMTHATLHLATTDAGNELLARDPLALLVAVLLDQQIVPRT